MRSIPPKGYQLALTRSCRTIPILQTTIDLDFPVWLDHAGLTESRVGTDHLSAERQRNSSKERPQRGRGARKLGPSFHQIAMGMAFRSS